MVQSPKLLETARAKEMNSIQVTEEELRFII